MEAAGIDPTWSIVTWWREVGTVERLPPVPASIKYRLRGYQELCSGLGNLAGD